jgi:hypothetical protein
MIDIAKLIFSAIGGFITAFLAFKKDDKSSQLKYITDERKEWRVKIRKLVIEFLEDESINITDTKLRRIRTEIAINLNPEDDEDNNILDLMDTYIIEKNDDNRKKLTLAFSFLLKHDWERAKNEAKSGSIFSPLKVVLSGFIFYKSIQLTILLNKFFSTNCTCKQECLLKSIGCLLCCIVFLILVYFLLVVVWKKIFVKCFEEYEEGEIITDLLNINVRKKLSKK